MELLVISDAHGNRAAICEALRRQVRPPDALLFLGDGLRDLPDLPDGRTALYAVAGNCDGYLPFFTEGEDREICLLSLGEHRLLLTHGHRFGVKSGCGALLAYAASERMKAAGAEDIINADAYAMALIRGTIAPQTTLGKAVAHT